jgi:cephalosporin hydroxylase
MDEIEKFRQEVQQNIESLAADKDVQALSRIWAREVTRHKYPYNFTWMGRPLIQLPQDMIAMQEIIWQVQPELIIETGVAHGGSLIYYASLLELIGGAGRVLGIDIDIRPHNRAEIEKHPMARRIDLLQGSSIAPEMVAEVRQRAVGKRILVVLDSNHTHDHVKSELEAYAPLVPVGSYCVVMDTLVEDMPPDLQPINRPWGLGNNPKTAVWEYLKTHPEFEIDKSIQHKLLITVAPDGYLKRVA